MESSPSTDPLASAMDAAGAPDWLVNVSGLAWRILVVALLVGVAWVVASILSVVLASILLGMLVAAAAQPLMVRFRKRGWNTTKAAGVVTAIVVGAVTLTIIVLALALVPFFAQLIQQLNDGMSTASSTTTGSALPADTQSSIQAAVSQLQQELGTTSSSIGTSIANLATIAILAAILVFFFLRDGLKALLKVVPEGIQHRREIIGSLGRDALPASGRYLRVTATFAAIDAAIAVVVLFLLGVPLAAPLAVVVFLVGFFPYLGVPIAIATLAVAALASKGWLLTGLLVAILIAAHYITRRRLNPVLKPVPTGLNPASVLITVLIAWAYAGYAGVVAVVPAYMLARAIISAVRLELEASAAASGSTGGARAALLVPGWLDHLADLSWRLLVTFALAAFVIAILLAVPIVVLPLLIAGVLAATLAPLVRVLVARGWSTLTASLAATGGTFLIVGGLIVLAGLALVAQGQQVATTAQSGASSDSSGVVSSVVAPIASGISSNAASIGKELGGVAVVILLSAVLCFYLLRDGRRQWAGLMVHLPPPSRPQLTGIAADAAGITSRYMVGTGAISAFGAATQFLIMFVLGIPMALPLAVLAFFGGFIPYIGSFITTGIAFLVTVATGTPFDIAVMLIWTVVFNVVTGNVVAPIVYSRAVNIHPAIVLLSIPAGSAIAGVLGMFLAVPVVAIAMATWRQVVDLAGTMPPALNRLDADVVTAAADAPAATNGGPPAAGSTRHLLPRSLGRRRTTPGAPSA